MANKTERLNKLNSIFESKGIEFLDYDIFKNEREKYNFRCLKCGTYFNKTIYLLKTQQEPCPKCTKEAKRLRHLDKVKSMFDNRMEKENLNKYYEVIEYPKLIRDNATFKHIKCGNIINTSIGNLSRINKSNSSGCKYCSKTHTYTPEEIKNYMLKNRPNYIFLDSFMSENSHLMVKVKHKLCGNVTTQQFNYFKRCNGCSKCHISNGEELIKLTLDNMNVDYEQEKEFKGMYYMKPLKLDFYLPKDNIAIEYDGVQHTKPPEHWGDVDIRQQRDIIKNNFCLKNKITLYRIPFTITGEELINIIKFIVNKDNNYANKFIVE